MEKLPVQSNKAQSQDWCDTETYKGKTMKAREFEVTASSGDDGPPLQRKGDVKAEVSWSADKSVLEREGNRKFTTTKGTAPDPKSPNSKVWYEKSADVVDVSDTLFNYNGVDLLSANLHESASLAITKRGVKADVNVDAGAYAAKGDYHWDLGPFNVEVFGEQTEVNATLRVSGSLGVEAKMQLEANIGKIQSTKKLLNITEKNLKYGIQGEVDAFAGLKVEVGIDANYDWKKKEKQFYINKFKKNAAAILDEVEKTNPKLGGWLRELPLEEAENLVGNFLYGLGSDGKVNLAEVEAGAWAGLGAGAQIGGGMRITRGRFYYHTKQGAAWGLGFGGDASFSFDLLEGTLFGLAVGGELLPAAIAEVKNLLSEKTWKAFEDQIWNRLAFWREKRQANKLEYAGKHSSSNSNVSSKVQSSCTVKPLPQQPQAPMCVTSYNPLLGKDPLKPIDYTHYPIGIQ
jgi:hypothetical protein